MKKGNKALIEKYKTIYENGEGEIIEKKSRFIATIRYVETEEEAILFIEELKKKYWNATHNCSAYIIGKKQEIMRCSDDGEPSQTAGKPMLDVLLGQGLCNVACVVTRYFGGTLLGTGGLVRAYSGAVKEGLQHCVIVEKKLAEEIIIHTDYNSIGKIQYILAQEKVTPTNTEYTDVVEVTVPIPMNQVDNIISQIVEGTNGKAQIEKVRTLYYGVIDKEVILFDD